MKKTTPFKDLSKAAIGVGTVGLITGVGSSVATKAGVPGIAGGFNTVADFTGIAVMAYGGKTVIKELKNLNRR